MSKFSSHSISDRNGKPGRTDETRGVPTNHVATFGRTENGSQFSTEETQKQLKRMNMGSSSDSIWKNLGESRSMSSSSYSARSSGSMQSSGKNSFRSTESSRIIPFSSAKETSNSGTKSWASVVSGPTRSKGSTVIRPKAAPLMVIPREDVGPYSADFVKKIPSFSPSDGARVLRRSESDGFARRDTFVPSYIQANSENFNKIQGRLLGENSGEQREKYYAGWKTKSPLENDAASYEKKNFNSSWLSQLPLPERYEHFAPNPTEFVEVLRRDLKLNPGSLVLNFKNARCFIVRGCDEMDLLYSLPHGFWSGEKASASFSSGSANFCLKNQKLDAICAEQLGSGPVYLFFILANADYFSGMAELLSGLESPDRTDFTTNHRWKTSFRIKWIFVKDVPNESVNHLRTEAGQPVGMAKDCSEVSLSEAKQLAKLIQIHPSKTSLLDSFLRNKRDVCGDYDPDDVPQPPVIQPARNIRLLKRDPANFIWH